MEQKISPPIKVLDAVSATGAGKAQLVEDFRHVILALDTTGSANFTMKVQGSESEEQPDWTSSQSPSNQWDYLQIKDLEDGSSVDGDTGVSQAGSDDNRQFEVNINQMRWINVRITSHSAGDITVTLSARTN